MYTEKGEGYKYKIKRTVGLGLVTAPPAQPLSWGRGGGFFFLTVL